VICKRRRFDGIAGRIVGPTCDQRSSIAPQNFGLFARQLVLQWHPVGTQIVGGLKRYHPNMKWIRSPRTELRHISAVYYIMCHCDLWPILPKLGHV